MIIISCKHGTARPMNYHLQTACPLKQAYTFSTIHTAQSNAILTRWRAHETKRTAPCVFCVFQPYRARPMANAGRGRVVEGYREGKTKWEGQARARKPRRREAEQQKQDALSDHRSRTVPVLVLHSSTAPLHRSPSEHSLPPSPHRSRPVPSPVRLLTTPVSPFSLSVAPHPPICLARLVLLYYTPAPSNYSSAPLCSASASAHNCHCILVNRLVRTPPSCRRECRNTPSTQTSIRQAT